LLVSDIIGFGNSFSADSAVEFVANVLTRCSNRTRSASKAAISASSPGISRSLVVWARASNKFDRYLQNVPNQLAYQRIPSSAASSTSRFTAESASAADSSKRTNRCRNFDIAVPAGATPEPAKSGDSTDHRVRSTGSPTKLGA